MLIVLAGIPVACTGGILALLITRTTFSISAAMGFVSIFGISVQDALLVVTYAPAALSRGIGADTQRPLAIVVIGGALMLAILPRLLQPALLVLAHRGERG